MSSGFVSGGTSEAPIQRSDEWLAAQREIDSNIVAKQEAARASEGKSLYETLQANKAAKEDAFAEASKLKNQFRSLDEDEISFLDSVAEGARAEDERVKREMREGLEAFKRQQEEIEKAAKGESEDSREVSTLAGEEWDMGVRKRKRGKEKVVRGVKRKEDVKAVVGAGADNKAQDTKNKAVTPAKTEPAHVSNVEVPAKEAKVEAPVETVTAKKSTGSGLGLVAYGSDSEDE